MRVLIALVTVLGAAVAATVGGGAAVAEPGCAPRAASTVWSWPVPAPGSPARALDVLRAPDVLRGFEPPAHRWDAGHRGVDLAGEVGDPVLAAGAGVVLFAGRLFGRGVVVVGHGVLRTSYEPVEASVPVGARVAVGERIGTLDAGHCAARPCLHWGLLTGHGHATTYFDPLLLLGCGGLRLEPVMTGPGSR
ncbi:MAG TPA: peptidoglycan DD-metalloendopeptidase family protein [Actinospica sp.]|nr:peptidoglycan DD-metalloendopeptidase family protein [Actinospica sp.]